MIQTLFGGARKPGLLERIQEKIAGAVAKTRESLVSQVEEIFQGKSEVGPELLRSLEATLIGADLGVKTVAELLARVRAQAEADRQRKDATTPAAVRAAMREELLRILCACDRMPAAAPEGQPLVVMLVGVNGTGKTTTIGKLARHYVDQKATVLICAADTFRAAATEQVGAWAGRAGVEMIQQKPGADPSAVLFDAMTAARARHLDVVLVDTAGRLHTKTNLMQELAKMRRTAERLQAGAPHEVLLVLDATTGQNGLQQARQFTQATALTGLIVTKLDGTARGGIVVAIARDLNLPVRYVGVGEKAEDLLPFSAEAFVDGLLGPTAR